MFWKERQEPFLEEGVLSASYLLLFVSVPLEVPCVLLCLSSSLCGLISVIQLTCALFPPVYLSGVFLPWFLTRFLSLWPVFLPGLANTSLATPSKVS